MFLWLRLGLLFYGYKKVLRMQLAAMLVLLTVRNMLSTPPWTYDFPRCVLLARLTISDIAHPKWFSWNGSTQKTVGYALPLPTIKLLVHRWACPASQVVSSYSLYPDWSSSYPTSPTSQTTFLPAYTLSLTVFWPSLSFYISSTSPFPSTTLSPSLLSDLHVYFVLDITY